MRLLILLVAFMWGWLVGHADAAGLLQGEELRKEVSERCAKGCVVMTEADIEQMREQLEEIQEHARQWADEEAKRVNAWMCTTRVETNPDLWGGWAK